MRHKKIPGLCGELIEIIISLCHYLFYRLYLGVNITDGVSDELNAMGMGLKRVRVQVTGY